MIKIKPALLTSVGMIMTFVPYLISLPPVIQKIGAGFIVVGTIIYLFKK